VAGYDRPVQDVPAYDGRITLGQLLKLTGLVDRGSETRAFLAGGRVTVNGLPEPRRGRKLVEGDVVIAPGHEPLRVTIASSDD
jgi:ribosome-associated protein